MCSILWKVMGFLRLLTPVGTAQPGLVQAS